MHRHYNNSNSKHQWYVFLNLPIICPLRTFCLFVDVDDFVPYSLFEYTTAIVVDILDDVDDDYRSAFGNPIRISGKY